jgi:predicted DNA-binding transcriptional regulator AlpA
MRVTTKRKLAGSTALPSQPTKVLLGFADLHALGISYSRQHLYRKMADGTFPRPVALGSETYARKAWRRADILAWIAALT